MSEADRERLRTTFNEDARRYARARPDYPERLFDDLADLAGARPGRRLLEIGCGTGQATVPLAGRGCRIVAVEMGAHLAAVARERLTAYADARVVVGDFEEWPLPAEPFDVVLAATAFHWIDPAVRIARCAAALRPGGALAVVDTHHVAGGSEEFFAEVQGPYERFMPGTPPGLRLSPAADVPEAAGEPAASGLFGPPTVRRYEWERTYTSAEYVDLLLTYSGHRALAEPTQRDLLAAITDLIDNRYGGRITKRYLTQLAISTRNNII